MNGKKNLLSYVLRRAVPFLLVAIVPLTLGGCGDGAPSFADAFNSLGDAFSGWISGVF